MPTQIQNLINWGGGSHLEGIRFRLKNVTSAANITTFMPVDTASVTQEQTDKWLVAVAGDYHCSAPKAGYYTLQSGAITVTGNTNVMYSGAQRKLATTENIINLGWTAIPVQKNVTPVNVTCWLNAGDILYVVTYTTAQYAMTIGSDGLFLYLGNDAGDY